MKLIRNNVNVIYNEDCALGMSKLNSESVDLTITSPPYDDLRKYKGNSTFDFETVAKELYRVTKKGGVVVWVVSDQTDKGSETLTSFKQALYFKEVGFNVHDTMIYAKNNYVPLNHNRYEQCFEYMFVFSKGRPKTFNPIKVPCKYAGTNTWGNSSFHKTNNSGLVDVGGYRVKDEKIKPNIFYYTVGSVKNKGIKFPAPFPEQLVQDHIHTWTNEGDTVLDVFLGSGTTACVAKKMRRNYIGFEIVKEYYDLARSRILDI